LWKQHHAELRMQLGIPPDSTPLADMRFHPTGARLPDRCRDLLEIAWSSRAVRDRRRAGVYVDVGPSAERCKWGSLKRLTKRSVIVDFEGCRVLSPRHLLALQGHPAEAKFDSLSLIQQARMAGEGMFLPSLAMVLLPVIVTKAAPWLEKHH